ncbi:MAG: MBL fold metallo-hydrolase [Thermoproteus sp. AZ2]|jgi:7,8-dihydropterin-6-yl-methyl-4-(beta-D-ribofuranosyl)aminobenzene 5'-phosphate synthase|uniref:MBL fold metallo-hydrolase n=1 Tax=Thermoproteus sp. AZ2 TaxID=1609232 RepID=A0ACC6UZA7_9CREN|nr:MAG: beta-lactamase [Thermoproteus sp. AZ2]
MRLTILVDNYATSLSSLRLKLLAEWGFAAYLHEARVLYDVGSSGAALINNMKALGIPIDEPDYLVFSHRHDDHTGGLKEFLERRRRPITIIAHENLFAEAYAKDQSGLFPIGIPMGEEELRRHRAVKELVLIKGPYKVAEGVYVSGEIPRRWGPTHNKGVYGADKTAEDQVPDDAALYVASGDEMSAVTGCGHSGVENIIEYGLYITGAKRVKAVVGGLHLLGFGRERVEEVIRYLKAKGARIVVGTHCTGPLGMALLSEAFGSPTGGVGATIDI